MEELKEKVKTALETEKELCGKAQELAELTAKMNVSTTITVSENPDSMELDFGGPRKCTKIYFDASKPEEARKKIENAIELNKYKDKLIGGGEEQ